MEEILNILDELSDKKKETEPNENICRDCHEDLIIADNEYVCPKCGLVSDQVIFSTNSKSIEKTHSIRNKCIYKRINHLKNYLDQLQGRTNKQIPDKIVKKIKRELKNRQIDINTLTIDQLYNILKELNYSKYYYNLTPIYCLLTNKKQLRIKYHHENKIKDLFIKLQIPFEKNKSESRKNFLRYSYIIYKICELLQYDEYLPFIHLLKNKKKIAEHDNLWKSICEQMNWKFYETVI